LISDSVDLHIVKKFLKGVGMKAECELLATCGYFEKYQHSKETLCQGWIRQYCCGPLMDECKRKIYRREKGEAPPVDMMPSGHIAPDAQRIV
jgi:hypothetical protein